jgi:S-DNA-T family DNA segregation ATPase FtsK/SpoIIIE
VIIRRRVNSSTGAAPVVILDGRRDNGAIISGVFAEPQWPGKAIYATATGNDGVLIGWTPPPTPPSPAQPNG